MVMFFFFNNPCLCMHGEPLHGTTTRLLHNYSSSNPVCTDNPGALCVNTQQGLPAAEHVALTRLPRLTRPQGLSGRAKEAGAGGGCTHVIGGLGGFEPRES